MNQYDSGDIVRINVGFTNQAGTAVDPGVVTAKVKDPRGTISIYVYGASAIARDSTGNYRLDLEPTLQGVWTYRWAGTVTNIGAGENSFQIRESAFD